MTSELNEKSWKKKDRKGFSRTFGSPTALLIGNFWVLPIRDFLVVLRDISMKSIDVICVILSTGRFTGRS